MGRKKTRAADIKRRLIEDDEPISPFASIKLVEKKEPEKKKPVVKPVPKKPSEIVQGYNPSSSFADILYSYEHTGNPYSMPPKARKTEIAASKTDFGAILDKWEGRGKKSHAAKTGSESTKSSYKPTKSFGDILASYEGKPIQKKAEKVEREIIEDLPDDAPLFRKENDDEKRSPEAVWSIFGGNEGFARKKAEKPEVAEENEAKPVSRVSEPYHPVKSFGAILKSFEEKGKRKAEAHGTEKIAEINASIAEKPLSETLFKKESDDEKRSPEAVWSVFGNNRIPERNTEIPADSEKEKEVSHSSYDNKGTFSQLLSSYEKKSEKTFDEIMKEKGDNRENKQQLTITKLRTMPPQATLDLHGETIAESEAIIKSFLAECSKNGIRKISIITGKGLHSENGIGVLRETAIRVLNESGIVSEMNSAPLSAGGSGALWIILKA